MSGERCRCQIVGWGRDPYEPHIAAQPEWEQADDCPVHPLPTTEPSEVAETTAGERCLCGPCQRGQTHVCDGNKYLRCDNATEPDAGEVEALAKVVTEADPDAAEYDVARAVLASPWLAARVSAAETKARAEALWEFADTRGVNVGDEDDEWWRGYRQAQRECLHDAVARAASIARGDAR